MYGPWRIEEEDKLEVYGYRAGISAAAIALLLGSAASYLPAGEEARHAAEAILNPLCILGSAGLGISLFLIHIYVTPLKRTLQALWGAGTLGGVYLMTNHPEAVPVYVAHHPAAVWAVGPLFASLTGVAFKEGLCYGKAEAGLLFGVIPLLLLGHLTQLMPPATEAGFLAAFVALFSIFAARKYTQPVKDDIGDKSVFTFMKLSPQEQEQVLATLRRQQPVAQEEYDGDDDGLL